MSALYFWSPASAAATPWLRAVVTTRGGGASADPYRSLNLGLSTPDVAEHVHENRARVRRALEVPESRLHLLHQVHGTDVWDAPGPAGRSGDGLRTSEAGVVLGVGIADCVPVFVWDAQQRRIAVVHAGWRGTAAGILSRALAHFVATGAAARDLHVALGPCIGPCCYAVSEDVAERFPAAAVTRRDPSIRLDLRAANRAQALEVGVPPQQVEADPPCTACTPDLFFSHRRDHGRTGRMWALCWIVPGGSPTEAL